MFSIIIPLYNKAAYIEKCIQSVLSQTYQEFELIVVDDGSVDNPLSPKGGTIVERLHFISNISLLNDKVRIIEQANQGVSTARNNGVKLAKYDYIAFLDADDWWEPTYLEEMKTLIEKYPNGALYSSSYYKVVQGRNITAHIGVNAKFTEGLIDYFEVYAKTMYQPVWTGATIIKKEVFDDLGGFRPRLKMGEDFDLWYRVALDYPVILLNRPLAYYNQDVELTNRAVGSKLYIPEHHFLFSDYDNLKNHTGFYKLFEILAIYGLLPYYLAGKNQQEVNMILKQIHWSNHSIKYFLYYRVLPKWVVRWWFNCMKLGASLKRWLRAR